MEVEDETGGSAFGLMDSSLCIASRAGVLRCFLEILSIGWKDLPARHLLPQYSDRSHVGEFTPQTLVVLLGGGKPHSVVGRLLTLSRRMSTIFS